MQLPTIDPIFSVKETRLIFIDSVSYYTLTTGSNRLPLADFENIIDEDSTIKNRLSVLALEHLVRMNSVINGALFGRPSYVGCTGLNNLTSLEVEYSKRHIDDFLKDENQYDEPFYEILPINDTTHLVVVRRGFLNYLAHSKDDLSSFVLTCLGSFHSFKRYSYPLNRLFLSLKYIEGYHLLIKARIKS